MHLDPIENANTRHLAREWPASHSNINLLPSAGPLSRRDQGRTNSKERSVSESPVYSHVTLDAIQSYGDDRFNDWFARRVTPLIGFAKTTIVGCLWVKLLTPDGMSLESEFLRVLGLKFDQLLSAHVSLLTTGAHEACERAVDKIYPRCAC